MQVSVEALHRLSALKKSNSKCDPYSPLGQTYSRHMEPKAVSQNAILHCRALALLARTILKPANLPCSLMQISYLNCNSDVHSVNAGREAHPGDPGFRQIGPAHHPGSSDAPT